MEKTNDVLIVAIINKGNLDLVMQSAKLAGAKGGTVLNANGTASKKIKNQFGLPILPEKDLILILCNRKDRDAIFSNIYKALGIETSEGTGVIFALPVEKISKKL
jgi:nitrogen regulatory protein PII